VRTQCVHKGV